MKILVLGNYKNRQGDLPRNFELPHEMFFGSYDLREFYRPTIEPSKATAAIATPNNKLIRAVHLTNDVHHSQHIHQKSFVNAKTVLVKYVKDRTDFRSFQPATGTGPPKDPRNVQLEDVVFGR